MCLLKNICVVNEGTTVVTDVLLRNGRIYEIAPDIPEADNKVIDGSGKWLLPGVIDAQVHFRDPGFTEKGDLLSESKAAVAGGTTSFIDMPNTRPNTLNIELLADKYRRAAYTSVANFGFLLGVNEENLDSILQMDTSRLLAISDDGLYFTQKGNLLADRPELMAKLFTGCKAIVALHAEKEELISRNEDYARTLFGERIPFPMHPLIRSREACLTASKQAIEMAIQHGGRLHLLHITTADECALFRNDIPLEEKQISSEVCVQNLWFSDQDYDRLGAKIKWNPAIKSEHDKEELLRALIDDRIDIITTDHAPHLLAQKNRPYFESLSGAPMVQHGLSIMLELHVQGKISLTKIAEKMCHNPARLYHIKDRGFIRKGYFADLVIVDPQASWEVSPSNILYKCGWSPLEGTRFHTRITHSFVNGNLVYDGETVQENFKGMALEKRM